MLVPYGYQSFSFQPGSLSHHPDLSFLSVAAYFLSNGFMSRYSSFRASIFQRDLYATLILLKCSSFPPSSTHTPTTVVLSWYVSRLYDSTVRQSLHLWSILTGCPPITEGKPISWLWFSVCSRICLWSLLQKLLLWFYLSVKLVPRTCSLLAGF